MANGILNLPIIKVVGDRTAKVLITQLGIETLGDLLRHYPRRYVARGELTDIQGLVEGEEVTILAEIESAKVRKIPGRKGGILEVTVTDGRAKLSLTFFNQAWREKELQSGRQGLFAGKVGLYKGKRQLSHPDYQLIPDGNDVDSAIGDFAGKYLPMYPATAKLPSWKIAQCTAMAVEALEEIPDYLPSAIKEKLGFPTLHEAFVQVHNPESPESAELARKRLTFDEALLLQLLLVLRRVELHKLFTESRKVRSGGLHEAFDERLPFKLTAGQIEVSKEIEEDLAAPHPMYRLLQGEVGSGKTIIALRAMLAVLDSGGQAALLAPTEVLAAQHFRSFHNLLGDLASAGQIGGDARGTQIVLLTGSQSGAARKESLQKAQNGEAGIIIGTHALLSENVEFKDLGLIVVDEQHRFGVEQRDALRAKANNPPHVLVMTATPIPRTVAMTVFGDLDVSTLRELPAGRSPITTHVIPELEKPGFIERAWQRIREEVSIGHQVYIVAPRIAKDDSTEDAMNALGLSAEALARVKRLSGDGDEELENEKTEKFPMVSVSELYPLLGQGALKGLRIAVLHGRLASDVKDKTMSEFSRGEIDVLISTTVIEVGVDVPNATMMVIMDADRFGVSQLHQLRGRVGRGSAPGLCLLVSKSVPESPAMERLNAVASTLDGFELSRIDLEQRREGDVLGASQSGVRSHLRLLRVLRDEELIESAREIASKLIDEDPDLSENPLLKVEVAELQALESAAFIDKR